MSLKDRREAARSGPRYEPSEAALQAMQDHRVKAAGGNPYDYPLSAKDTDQATISKIAKETGLENHDEVRETHASGRGIGHRLEKGKWIRITPEMLDQDVLDRANGRGAWAPKTSKTAKTKKVAKAATKRAGKGTALVVGTAVVGTGFYIRHRHGKTERVHKPTR